MAGGAFLSLQATHCNFFLGKSLYNVPARPIFRVQKEIYFPHKANPSFPIEAMQQRLALIARQKFNS
jgi:hypothetical protein